jgi:molybdate-binding protein/DNA-binding transcriptional regulator YhcF (GntR family)
MMDNNPLFQEIAETIRRKIFSQELKPGDKLPTVRAMSKQWNCAPGTVQKAYKELARQGMVTSRPGLGTCVTPRLESKASYSLRKASLINQIERFLLGLIREGYQADEIGTAFRSSLDRWHTTSLETQQIPQSQIRFAGSHDPIISMIKERFNAILPSMRLDVSFTGSLGGLMALSRGEADLAGSHLWDEQTNLYNRSFVKRLLPGRKIALVTVAQRELGLIVAPGNPLGIQSLEDLARPNLRLINRQPGAGTRVWLSAQLRRRGIPPERIKGYRHEVYTHSAVASAVMKGEVDTGLGIKAAAMIYGLSFIPLTVEHYELVIPVESWESTAMKTLIRLLTDQELINAINDLGGYITDQTGQVEWVN